MVSLGTIFTLGVVGAVIAGGYAVYRNSDKIGAALSRGVAAELTNPLGEWADNLWASIAGPSDGSGPGPSSIAGETVIHEGAAVDIPSDTYVGDSGIVTGSPPTQTLVPEDEQTALDALAAAREEAKRLNEQDFANVGPNFSEGYYYFNFLGSQYDYQAKLSASEAELFSEEALRDPSDFFENIKYLGRSKLGETGLNLFAKSQNYL